MGKKKGKTMALADFLGSAPVEEVALPTRPLNEKEREVVQQNRMKSQQRAWGDVENPGFDDRSPSSTLKSAAAGPSPADADDWRRADRDPPPPQQGRSQPGMRFNRDHDDRQPVTEPVASDPFMEKNWRDAPKIDQFAGTSQSQPRSYTSRSGPREGDRDQFKGGRDQFKGDRDQFKGDRDQFKGPHPVETGPSEADAIGDWRSGPRSTPAPRSFDGPQWRNSDSAPRSGDQERPRKPTYNFSRTGEAAEANDISDWRSVRRENPPAAVEERPHRSSEGGYRHDQRRDFTPSDAPSGSSDSARTPLNLAPRSTNAPSSSTSGSSKPRSDPFGGARPREEVILKRGTPTANSGNAE